MTDTESRDHSDLRKSLQEDTLLEILQRQNGSLRDRKGEQIKSIGREVKEEINPRLIDDFREPIEIDDFTVGFIALLYDIVNETPANEELRRGDSTQERRLTNR